MSECKRAVLSCQRCRKRKIKCDRVMPSCSQCINAQTTCTGFDGTDDPKGVPRSIVRHLEFEIAKLETEIDKGDADTLQGASILIELQHPALPALNATSIDHNGSEVSPAIEKHLPPPEELKDALLSSIISSQELQSMITATMALTSGADNVISKVRMGLTPSSTKNSTGPTNRTFETQRSSVSPKPASLSVGISTRILSSVPLEILEGLVGKYARTIVPQFPFMLGSEVNKHLKKMLKTLESHQQTADEAHDGFAFVKPSLDFLIVYLVLAISINIASAKGGHEARCMSFSASLFEEGLQHITGQVQMPSDLISLQVNLLILLYATINPRAGNVWILSGTAMRICLELGLHRDIKSVVPMDADQNDLRRRIFWSAYCLDRSICAALQRPLSIPENTIEAQLPRPNPEFSGRIPFMGTIDYHKMQSEILQTHFADMALPSGWSWEEWQTAMEKRLRHWYEISQSETPVLELIDFHLARGLTILHRPSPRNKMPSQRSLLIAFEAASSAAQCQSDHIKTGAFRRHWLSAHFTLEMAVIALFCLRYACQAICDKFESEQVFAMTKVFTSNFLHISSQGWPEVSKYAGIYERLLGPLLQAVFSSHKDPNQYDDPDFSFVIESIYFNPSQDAELTALLYPGPAELGNITVGIKEANKAPAFDISVFDFDEFNFDFNEAPTDLSTSFLTGFELLDHALSMDDYVIGLHGALT